MSLFSRLFGSTPGAAKSTPDVVDVQEARRRQSAGAVLIDVRQPEEWRQGHAPKARLIPLGALQSHLAEIPRDREVLLICRSGNRSGAAQRQLLRLGYQQVYNVAGGMNAWAGAGLPVSR
ncbi:MAG TPA: rhodanese-like domain-containing protein [Chloroflexota bacterium]